MDFHSATDIMTTTMEVEIIKMLIIQTVEIVGKI